MYKIYIDTAERYKKKVALLKDEQEIDFVGGEIDVVQSIKDILFKNDLVLADVALVDANPGPGSFTGIKMGVTVANVLNWIAGKKGLDNLIKPNYGKNPNI